MLLRLGTPGEGLSINSGQAPAYRAFAYLFALDRRAFAYAFAYPVKNSHKLWQNSRMFAYVRLFGEKIFFLLMRIRHVAGWECVNFTREAAETRTDQGKSRYIKAKMSAVSGFPSLGAIVPA